MARPKKILLEETRAELDGAIAVTDVTPGTDYTGYGLELEQCLQILAKKHPELKFAWVNVKKTFQILNNGWTAIKVHSSDKFERVDSVEKADVTELNVLAVRPMAVEMRAREQEVKDLEDSNRRQKYEMSRKGQAEMANRFLRNVHPDVGATPISEAEA